MLQEPILPIERAGDQPPYWSRRSAWPETGRFSFKGVYDELGQQRDNANLGHVRHRRNLITRHAHQDALTNREFERLLKACEQLPDRRRFEARLICLLAGRLGLRAGEISHLTTKRIDWDRKLIRIPQHEDCECGYCRRHAQQEADHKEALSYAEAMQSRWHPKTVASARVIPFDVSLRVELCIERFADQYSEFPESRSTGLV